MKKILIIIISQIATLQLIAQDSIEFPKVNWQVSDIEKTSEEVRCKLKSNIPEGWMITTEESKNIMRLGIYLDEGNDQNIVSYDFKQVSGELIRLEKFKEIFSDELVTTQGVAEFQVALKINKEIIEVLFKEVILYLEYWQLDEWRVLPAQEEKICID